MSQVDKYGNVLDDKKEAVFTTSFSEKKLLTTEKVTTNYDVHKRIEKFTTSEKVVKGTYQVYKRTDNIKTNKDFEKST